METRPLQEVDISGKRRTHVLKQCKHCKHKSAIQQFSSGTSQKSCAISHPMCCGRFARSAFVGKRAWAKHGYRVQTDMMDWYRPKAVEDQIAELVEINQAEFEQAEQAYAYLINNEHSSYRKFTERHAKFLKSMRRS